MRIIIAIAAMLATVTYGQGLSGPANAAGDATSSPAYQNVTLSPTYNLVPANGRTYTSGTGSVSATGQEFKCSTGTTSLSYGTLQSFRAIRAKSGAGVTVRASGRFPSPVASSWSGLGAFTIGDEVSFGFNGTTFGVWHRYGGLPEVQTLTVTGAAGGSENATINVDGTEYTVALTSGTVQHNAQEIAAYLDANATGWEAYQSDDDVILMAQSDSDKTGTFSFSSSTATATFAETTAGVAKTSTHVPQSSWSGTPFPDFDPENGNNYQIRYSAGGFGSVLYYIQDPATGQYELVHALRVPSEGSDTTIGNPGLHIGAYCVSIGSTTDFSVYCAYVTAFLDSVPTRTRNPRSSDSTASISTTEVPVLSIRCRRTYNGLVNQSEIEPLEISISNESTSKSATFRIYTNATLTAPNWQDIGTNLISQQDTSATGFSGGRKLASFTVGASQSVEIDPRRWGLVLPPTLEFTITAERNAGSAADVTAAIIWYEDI